jgi:hypothetical protein
MRIRRRVVALVWIVVVAQSAGSSPAVAAQAAEQRPATPASQQPVAPVPQPPAPVGLEAAPGVLSPLVGRTFTATTGMIFQSVRPDRVLDFEAIIGYLEAALAKTTDPAERAQAKGWRVFKAAEPGPNGSVIYVFVFDPAVPGADYGLGRILADAYPERIQEIWKLYTGALIGGGSLLNLAPVDAPPPAPPTARSVDAPPPAQRPGPPGRPGPLQPATPR